MKIRPTMELITRHAICFVQKDGINRQTGKRGRKLSSIKSHGKFQPNKTVGGFSSPKTVPL